MVVVVVVVIIADDCAVLMRALSLLLTTQVAQKLVARTLDDAKRRHKYARSRHGRGMRKMGLFTM